MTSTVTNISSLIDASYPIPGVDNNTQGFRDNFAAIKYAFSATSAEITDLQVIQSGLIRQINNITTPTEMTLAELTATNITVSTITANQFVGDGSLLTNVKVNAIFANFTATNVVLSSNEPTDGTAATLSAGNGRLLLSGVNGISVVGNETVTHTLVGHGGSGVAFYDDKLTFDSIDGLDIGYTFRLYSTETSAHTILSIDTATNTITTDPFDPTVAQAIGVGIGSPIDFVSGYSLGTVTYARSEPSSSVGIAGDKKGMIYASTTTLYVCTADFDPANTTTNIWVKTAVIGGTW